MLQLWWLNRTLSCRTRTQYCSFNMRNQLVVHLKKELDSLNHRFWLRRVNLWSNPVFCLFRLRAWTRRTTRASGWLPESEPNRWEHVHTIEHSGGFTPAEPRPSLTSDLSTSSRTTWVSAASTPTSSSSTWTRFCPNTRATTTTACTRWGLTWAASARTWSLTAVWVFLFSCITPWSSMLA